MDELKISRLFVNTIYPLREDEYLDELEHAQPFGGVLHDAGLGGDAHGEYRRHVYTDILLGQRVL